MRTLVTGGGGFLGRYLVEQLLQRGDQVRVFARGDYPELTNLGAEVVRGDLRDTAATISACQGCDSVFHSAAVPGIWGDRTMFEQINIDGTRHILDGCRTHHVSKLIFTSSPSVVYDGQPQVNADESLPYPETYLCDYPRTKAVAEKMVLAAHNREGLATIALRPHLIWGPRDNHLIPRLIARAKSGRLRRVGDGQNWISNSYVENTAAAHLQACDALSPGAACGGRAYFINEQDPVKLWDWVDEILDLAGLPPVRKKISYTAARRVGSICETVYGLLRISAEPPMTRFLASQLSQSHSFSVAAAERDFGYRPIVTTAEAMRRLGVWIKIDAG